MMKLVLEKTILPGVNEHNNEWRSDYEKMTIRRENQGSKDDQ